MIASKIKTKANTLSAIETVAKGFLVVLGALKARALIATFAMKKLAIATTAKKTALTMGVAGPIIATSTIAATAAIASSMSRFATGGFPSTGQMFLARETGPELIGTIGSRSAVVNNHQIVEAVSRGVYEATVGLDRTMRQVLRAIQEKDVSTYIDGRVITNTVVRIQKERGLSLVGGLNHSF